MSEPDLFVVCKNCSSEVSPYVTECPYCGQRVRKRAPRIDKGLPPDEQAHRRRPRVPSLSRLRRDEIPGIAPDTRPYATGAIILASLLATLLAVTTAVGETTGISLFNLGGLYGPPEGDWWRLATTPFLFDNAGYQFVALVAAAVFGTHLERRFGWWAPLAVFLLAGSAGAGVAVALSDYPALGANGAALGLLCAWLVDDRLAFRRGEDRGNDLLGVYAFAVVLLALAVAWDSARISTALAGAAAGALLGLVLSALRR